MYRNEVQNDNAKVVLEHEKSISKIERETQINRNLIYSDKYGLVVCHNGTIYQYKVIGQILDPNILGAYSIYEREEYEILRNAQTYEEIRSAHIEHLQDLVYHLLQAGVEFKEILWNER